MARGAGEGSIYKRKSDGRWCGQLTIGTDPKTGKQKRKYFYGDKRKDVAKQMSELKQKLFDGNYNEPSDMKVGAWLNRWNQGRKSKLAYGTFKSYRVWINNHINPEIGHIKLKDLTTRRVQKLLNDKLEDRGVEGKGGLAVNSVKHIYGTINAGLEQAVKEGLVNKNVAAAAEPPKKQEEEKLHTWTKKEVKLFLNAAKDHRYYLVFYIALNTGMRKGEILGLKWEDIDFKAKRISVNRQVYRTDEGLTLKRVKTKAGERVIPINDVMIQQLQKQKEEQETIAEMLNKEYNKHNLVNINSAGNPISPRNAYRLFKRLTKKLDIEQIRFHDLRHTFSTLFLQNGGNIKTLQQILGHASISTTMDTYSHVTDEMLNSATDNISSMFD